MDVALAVLAMVGRRTGPAGGGGSSGGRAAAVVETEDESAATMDAERVRSSAARGASLGSTMELSAETEGPAPTTTSA
jgi:hypothetical protein